MYVCICKIFNTFCSYLSIARWDSRELNEVKCKFRVTWHGEVTKEAKYVTIVKFYYKFTLIITRIIFSEWVTSVICLPLISLGKAAGPDWTCIAVGYNTGFVRFYTEVREYSFFSLNVVSFRLALLRLILFFFYQTGASLLGEQIHNESVLGIKCRSFRSSKHVGNAGASEEIYILYNSGVCILQGFPLFSTLRACRNHLAKGMSLPITRVVSHFRF